MNATITNARVEHYNTEAEAWEYVAHLGNLTDGGDLFRAREAFRREHAHFGPESYVRVKCDQGVVYGTTSERPDYDQALYEEAMDL